MESNNQSSPNDPRHWKFGVVYYNKDDKRLFPPKRHREFGWTINFANPWSILAFIAIMTVIIVPSIYLAKTKH